MSKPPGLKLLPLSSAIKWIIEKTSESMTRTEAKQSFYWALHDGFVPARADIEDSDGNIIERNQIIPREEWVQISVEEFCERWADRRFSKKASKDLIPFERQYYVNILIEREDLHVWFFPKQNEAKSRDIQYCYQWLLERKEKLTSKPRDQWLEEFRAEIKKPKFSERAFKEQWKKLAHHFPDLRIGAPGRKSNSQQ
jgi:hypothetical protein